MVGNEGLEIEQETFENLASRYWITAVSIPFAAVIVIFIKFKNSEFPREEIFYPSIGVLIGSGISLIVGRLILAAISGELESGRLDLFFGATVIGFPLAIFFIILSEGNLLWFLPAVVIGSILGSYLLQLFSWWALIKWLGILVGGIIIFGIPIISVLVMLEEIPVLFVGLLGLVIFLSFTVYKKGQKEPKIYFSPLPTILTILVTITTTGLPISALLYSFIIDSLATSFLTGGVVGALLGIILDTSARKAGQPGYVAAHILGVGFAICGIALGVPIMVIILISTNGFGFACC